MIDIYNAVKSSKLYQCLDPVNVGTFSFGCGHCPACDLRNSNHWFSRAEDIYNSGKYQLFVTLTYSNEFVPLIQYSPYCSAYQIVRANGEYLGTYFIPFKRRFYKQFSNFNFLSDDKIKFAKGIDYSQKAIAVLYKKDIQNFVKRVRITVARKFSNNSCGQYNVLSQTDLRYFCVGEYGPTTLRPHYHLIFTSDKIEYLHYIEKNLPNMWKFSSCGVLSQGTKHYGYLSTAEICTKSVSHYLSSYVASTTCVPYILQLPYTRSFHLGSKRPVPQDYDTIIENFRNILTFGTVPHEFKWNSDKGTYEPFLVPFGKLATVVGRPSNLLSLNASLFHRLYARYNQRIHDIYSYRPRTVRTRTTRLNGSFVDSDSSVDFDVYLNGKYYDKKDSIFYRNFAYYCKKFGIPFFVAVRNFFAFVHGYYAEINRRCFELYEKIPHNIYNYSGDDDGVRNILDVIYNRICFEKSKKKHSNDASFSLQYV